MNAYSGDIRRTRLAITGAAVFVSLLLALHVLRPDVDPTWTVISAYGLGSKWWLMSAAFAAMAAGCAALAVQLSPDVRSRVGWIGWTLLIISAGGFALAAVFPTDPISGAVTRTLSGRLHEVGALLGGMIPLAAVALSWALPEHPAWTTSRTWLWVATALVWGGQIVFVGAMATQLPPEGTLGPDVHIGWPNRMMVAGYAAWVIVCAWRARRAAEQRGADQRPGI